MAKRRNVLAGLGALAFGSGAMTMSGAFGPDAMSPESDLRVIADAQLRVRAARGADGSTPIVSSYNDASNMSVSSGSLNVTEKDLYGSWSDFFSNTVDPLITSPGQPEAIAAEINLGVNDQLGIRTGVTNRLDDEFKPLLEITNDSGSTYDVGVHFADNDSVGDSTDISGGPSEDIGYGGDVDLQSYDSAGNDQISRKIVQDIYQFQVDATTDPGGRNDADSLNLVDPSGGDIETGGITDGSLISPDPTITDSDTDPADEATQLVRMTSGSTIFVQLDFNTDTADSDGTNLTGEINSAAGGGNPFTDNSALNLLDNIFVSASSV